MGFRGNYVVGKRFLKNYALALVLLFFLMQNASAFQLTDDKVNAAFTFIVPQTSAKYFSNPQPGDYRVSLYDASWFGLFGYDYKVNVQYKASGNANWEYLGCQEVPVSEGNDTPKLLCSNSQTLLLLQGISINNQNKTAAFKIGLLARFVTGNPDKYTSVAPGNPLVHIISDFSEYIYVDSKDELQNILRTPENYLTRFIMYPSDFRKASTGVYYYDGPLLSLKEEDIGTAKNGFAVVNEDNKIILLAYLSKPSTGLRFEYLAINEAIPLDQGLLWYNLCRSVITDSAKFSMPTSKEYPSEKLNFLGMNLVKNGFYSNSFGSLESIITNIATHQNNYLIIAQKGALLNAYPDVTPPLDDIDKTIVDNLLNNGFVMEKNGSTEIVFLKTYKCDDEDYPVRFISSRDPPVKNHITVSGKELTDMQNQFVLGQLSDPSSGMIDSSLICPLLTSLNLGDDSEEVKSSKIVLQIPDKDGITSDEVGKIIVTGISKPDDKTLQANASIIQLKLQEGFNLILNGATSDGLEYASKDENPVFKIDLLQTNLLINGKKTLEFSPSNTPLLNLSLSKGSQSNTTTCTIPNTVQNGTNFQVNVIKVGIKEYYCKTDPIPYRVIIDTAINASQPVVDLEVHFSGLKTGKKVYLGIGKSEADAPSISNVSSNVLTFSAPLAENASIEYSNVPYKASFTPNNSNFVFTIKNWGREEFKIYACQDKGGDNTCGKSYVEINNETASITVQREGETVAMPDTSCEPPQSEEIPKCSPITEDTWLLWKKKPVVAKGECSTIPECLAKMDLKMVNDIFGEVKSGSEVNTSGLTELEVHAATEAKKFGLEPVGLVLALFQQESGWDPNNHGDYDSSTKKYTSYGIGQLRASIIQDCINSKKVSIKSITDTTNYEQLTYMDAKENISCAIYQLSKNSSGSLTYDCSASFEGIGPNVTYTGLGKALRIHNGQGCVLSKTYYPTGYITRADGTKYYAWDFVPEVVKRCEEKYPSLGCDLGNQEMVAKKPSAGTSVSYYA